ADDDTRHEPQRARQVGHGRGGYRPGQQNVDTRRREPSFQRRFEHVAGNARVLADHDGRPAGTASLAPGKHATGRVAEPQGEFGVDGGAADAAAYAVGAEIIAFAHTKDSSLMLRHTFTASTV